MEPNFYRATTVSYTHLDVYKRQGFDIDGGTENCFVQYCYSYFNDGPGFMHCDYPTSRVTQNNTIRYNISEYDGQQPYRDKSSLLFISWGSGLKNCLMYNNTSVIGNKANGLILSLIHI